MGWGSVVFPLLIITPSGGFTGLFLYSPGPGPGNLIGSWTAQAGTDPFGNSFPAGINVTSGNIAGVTISALSESLNPGPLLLDGAGDIAIAVFTTPGINNWTAPAGVTSVDTLCWGAGGGGDGADAGAGESGGGGGAFARVTNIAVTPATVYHPTVGAGGAANTNGGATSFAGDTVTVTANGGTGAVDPVINPPGGAASTTPAGVISFPGGAGGGSGGAPHGGGGGGSSASSSTPGNTGLPGTASAGGAGGVGPAGQYPGGSGGRGGNPGASGSNGITPGGGGGGGGNGGATAGGTGANGKVILIYSTLALATFVAIATEAATDPATGTSFNPGITTIDPVFGDTARLFGATVAIGASTTWTMTGASLDVATLGQGIQIKEGANGRQGTATLGAGGTVTVANTTVTANTRVEAFAQDNNSTGSLRNSARVVGTSFTITSSNAADNGVIAWRLWEPG